MASAIIIENLRKSFGEEEILHGICREFETGKIHGIVGNNGSGKTVMMKSPFSAGELMGESGTQ